MMRANRLVGGSFRGILVAALFAATVCFFVFVQSGEAAPPKAADDRPSAAKPSYQIVGGKPVPDGKYPFLAWIQVAQLDGTIRAFCGGSLIDPDSVLTAAHCVHPLVVGNKIRIDLAVGRTVQGPDQGQIRFVPEYTWHPRYNPQRQKYGSYDVAVLKLERAVTGIAPIKLASSRQNRLERPGRDATVAGWGKKSQRSVCAKPGLQPGIQKRMLEAQVPIISDSEGKKAFQQLPRCPTSPRGAFVPQLMIAAGTTGADACQGDSGGPLFVRTSGNAGNASQYTQIGVVSLGAGCANRYPGAYTELNAPPIRTFITKTASR
jgi:secreted trypsin-like serine protease